ncbi:MAG: NAD(P)-dependent oxidoreductase [Rubrivivax sp.]|nr:NAD(P)-dependent oxidoreductase [Rubrivivax sp.]
MSIWITGARGFIGRHVARAFASEGHEVVGLGHGAWPEAEHRLWGLTQWLNGEVSHANLDTLASLAGVPSTVVHLAGGSAVGPSFAQPAEDFHRSVAAAAALAEWLRLHAPSARLVMASSAAVYGASHGGPIAETTVCAPYSPYGFHKRMAELVLESYARNFGLHVAVVRLFSVYGPGLRKQLLWDACTRLAAGVPCLELGGTGDELRDWLHVEDAARLLVLGAAHAASEPWLVNGGTGVATPVRDIASCLSQALGRVVPVSFNGRSRSGDPASLVADTGKLQSLGFMPQRAWPEGVASYAAWYRDTQAQPPWSAA